jgi:hypothetical protein
MSNKKYPKLFQTPRGYLRKTQTRSNHLHSKNTTLLSLGQQAYSNALLSPLGVVHYELVKIYNDQVRNVGIRIQAGKGAGKSRLEGRGICFYDAVREIPMIILDPVGPVIDNLLDKIIRLPKKPRDKVLKRVRYFDLSGSSGYVLPSPLYYRYQGDSLYTQAQRFLEVVKKLDPQLQQAPVLGWNALYRIGTNTGMVLSALNLQVSEAESLLTHPQNWLGALTTLSASLPEVAPAVAFFQAYACLDERERKRISDSFLTKIGMFTFDQTMKAMYGASSLGIDYKQVEKEKLIVLADFRNVHILEDIRFKMRWFFDGFLEYIKRRGPTRSNPISLVVDELSYLLPLSSVKSDAMAADLDELINRIARNHNLWLTLAHQEAWQFDEKIQNTLLTIGTQIFGVTSDAEEALNLQKRYTQFDPLKIKKQEPVYNSGIEIDKRNVEFSHQEQNLMDSRRFLELPRYNFLIAIPPEEGSSSTVLERMNLEDLDAGQYVDEVEVAKLRKELAERAGRKIEEILAEIHARQTSLPLIEYSRTGTNKPVKRFSELK